MTVTLNGDPREIRTAITVRDLLCDLDLANRKLAVAVNSVFVPKSEHERHRLSAGDAIELLAPMQGG